MYLYLTDACGGLAAELWRATARAAASGMKPAKRVAYRGKERRMATTNGRTTNGRKDEGETTTDRFAARAHETVDTIAERAQRAERDVRQAAERTAEQARQLRDEYADAAEQKLRRATSYVESNPLAFAGIAFVAGVLFSSLLRR
jgi:ElaB/YqjD/DUF883 family membrane-anchored ribosome-binding protein